MPPNCWSASVRVMRAQGGVEIDLGVAEGEHHLARGLFGNRGDHGLDHGSHIPVVGVGLVRFEHRELGVVPRADAFVAKDSSELIDAVESAHDHPLQVQLEADAKRPLLVDRVEVGEERAGSRTPGRLLEDRRFHFEKATVVEEAADGTHDPAAGLEDFPGFLVGHQVQVAPALASLHVSQTVELLRRGTHCLRKQGPGRHGHRRLTGAGPHGRARELDEVSEVKQPKPVEGVADDVLPKEGLDATAPITYIGECSFPHVAKGDKATRDRDSCPSVRIFLAFGELGRLCGGVGAGAAGRVRIDAGGPGGLKLPQSLFPQLIHRPVPSFYRARPRCGAVNRCSST